MGREPQTPDFLLLHSYLLLFASVLLLLGVDACGAIDVHVAGLSSKWTRASNRRSLDIHCWQLKYTFLKLYTNVRSFRGLFFLGFCCTSSSSVLLWTPPSTATRLNFWGGTAHYPCSLREKSPIAKPPSGHLLCSTWLPEGWNLSVGQHVCRQMKKVRSILQSFSEAPMSVLRQLWLSSTGPPP